MCDSLRNLTKNNYQSCKVTGSLSIGGVPFPEPLTWTGCLPNECLDGKLAGSALPYLSAWLNKTTKGKVIADPAKWMVACEEDLEFDAGAYAAITFLAVVGSLVVFGTLWHLLHSILLSVREDTRIMDDDEDTDNLVQEQEPSEKEQSQIQSESMISKAIKCFALQRTFKTLTAVETKPGQVLCLNGIRVLSINWVILGHTFAFLSGMLGDPGDLAKLLQSRGFTLIANAFSSVDSFFTLSGFLVSFLLLKQLTKKGLLSIPQWTAFYVHRYIRLTTPYLVMILFEGFLYRHLVSGPFSVDIDVGTNHATCKQYWWTNLLYINNLVPWNPTGQNCLGQSWYLANDMQFFIIAPVFIVLLFAYPLIGNLVTTVTISCSAIAAAVITAHYNLAPSMSLGNPLNYTKVYRVPWTRISPYLVGILGGWFYWCWGEQVQEKVKTLPVWKKVVIATPLWIATAAVEYEVVFGLYHDIQDHFIHGKATSKTDSISYQMLARIGWSLALITQVLLCQFGLGGFINSLLSWKGWLVLSRLTYSVYLIHFGLIVILVDQTRHTFFVKPDFEFAVIYLGIVVMSYLAAVVLYVCVEQPVALLEGITYRK
ncbi:nose resistant to fluoxetine protein 6-like [Bolinopsis microptera]|uniref:nose resistant to fluoxetine protein 6-like n=1 Tax=Bolinopsis microptera TaxID=2820187 RepID=UPI00307AA206